MARFCRESMPGWRDAGDPLPFGRGRAGYAAVQAAVRAVVLALLVMPAACTPSASTSSPGPVLGSIGPVAAGGQAGAGNEAPATTPPSPSPSASPTPTPSPSPSTTASPSPTPPGQGPYIVKQTENQGGETVSGTVCDTRRPFVVHVVSPGVTFDWPFAPSGDSAGAWSYAYTFPSLGESHDASGTYTISPSDEDGTRQVATTGRDHVVFNGFDGMIPRNYSFDLVQSATTSCPTS
jgi:hypothetical protein